MDNTPDARSSRSSSLVRSRLPPRRAVRRGDRPPRLRPDGRARDRRAGPGDRARRRRRARRRHRGGRVPRRRPRSRPTRGSSTCRARSSTRRSSIRYVPTDRLAGKGPEAPEGRRRVGGAEARVGAARHGTGGASRSRPVRAEERAIDGARRSRTTSPTRTGAMGFAVVAAVPTARSPARQRRGRQPRRRPDLRARPRADERPVSSRSSPSPTTTTRTYPVSKMGAVAVTRQAFLDALWWRDAEAAYARAARRARRARASARRRRRSCRRRRARRPSSSRRPTCCRSCARREIAKEMKLKARYVGAGDEYRLRDRGRRRRSPTSSCAWTSRSPTSLDRRRGVAGRSARRGCARIDRAPSNPKWLRDAGLTFSFTTAGLDDAKDFRERVREAMARGLSKDDALAAVTTCRRGSSACRPARHARGRARSRTSSSRPARPSRRRAASSEIWIDGRADRAARAEKKESRPRRRRADARGGARGRTCARSRRARQGRWPRRRPSSCAAPRSGRRGRPGSSRTPTCSSSDGKIAAVGKELAAPAGAVEVDGRGKHVTPGIIDATRTPPIDGDVNEGTHNVTAEVRIQRRHRTRFDVADLPRARGRHDDRQRPPRLGQRDRRPERRSSSGAGAAGPTTSSSPARPPGSSSRSARTRSSRTGSNPQPRYPQTRMGVAESIRERVPRGARLPAGGRRSTAKAAGGQGRARRSRRSRTCSSRRSRRSSRASARSTATPTARTRSCRCCASAEEFGVKVATLQHVLEGYKVADEIAAHGAGRAPASPTGGPTSSRSTTRSRTTCR